MQRNDWKILLGGSIFTYLFYHQQAGINYLTFGILIILLAALNNLKNLSKPSVLISAVGLLLSGAFVYIYGTSLPIIGFLLSLSLFTSFITEPDSSLILSGFYGVCKVILAVPIAIGNALSKKESRPKPGTNFTKILLFTIPLSITVIFFFLYRSANPNFLLLTEDIQFDWISLPLLRFFILSIFVVYGLLVHFTFDFLKNRDLARTDNLEVHSLEEHQLGSIGKSLSVENELFIGAALLIMLNILLAIVNGMDIFKLWPNQVLPENLESFSAYLHNGIQTLITSIVLAVAIILFFFRGYFNYLKEARWLKVLGYIWIAQNIILLISTAMRNNMYVEAYGLSHKRIGVFIYLLLATIGLIFTAIKLLAKKNNTFLFRKNAWAFYIVLLICIPISWDKLITEHNFQLAANKVKSVDLEYLGKLSHINTAKLAENLEIEEIEVFNGSIFSYESTNLINNKIVELLEDMQTTSWQSSCLAKTENYEALLALNEAGKIPCLSINHTTSELKSLQILSNLKALSIQYYYGEENFDILKKFEKLEVLNFANNYNNPINQIPRLTSLKYLNLENNYIYDLQGIEKFTQVEYLRLSYNQIDSFEPLTHLAHLKKIYVDNMEEERKAALQASLPNVTIEFTNTGDYYR